LEEEIARLHKLEVELRAVESLPAPSAAASLPAAKPREEKPAPTAADLPKEPLKGFEEEFATALYALGNYDSARVAYRKLLEAKPKPDVQAWARFQIANCAKRAGDFPAAAAAYEELLTTSPTSPWAPEAAWWANEIKWRMRWDQTNP
jgi:TolA-binding protein